MAQFADWFAAAERAAPLAEAITLATVDRDGRPDARMVLLKGFDADGLSLLHQLRVGEGRQLDAAPAAALIAYWRELDRQVRVRGPVERRRAPESDGTSRPRPRESQLGAWASPQIAPARLARRSSTRAWRRDRALRRTRGAAAPALGRLPGATRDDRVLAGPGRAAFTIASATAATARRGALERLGPEPTRRRLAIELVGRSSSSSSSSSKLISARIPWRAERTRTPRAEGPLERVLGVARAPPSRSGCGTTAASASARRAFARRSVSRTDQPPATASRARRRRTSLPLAIRIARPWPSLSSPRASRSSASSGRSSSRIRFEIAGRVRPRRRRAPPS